MVWKLRKELTTDVSSAKRVGRDGKCRKMPKKKPAKETSGNAAAQDNTSTGGTEDEKPKHQEASESSSSQAQEGSSSSGSASADNFDPGQAWNPVKQYLLHELAKWPKSWHRTLGQRLQQFADDHCG
jgi:hypothetical protein